MVVSWHNTGNDGAEPNSSNLVAALRFSSVFAVFLRCLPEVSPEQSPSHVCILHSHFELLRGSIMM
jgi:hypothetical protein